MDAVGVNDSAANGCDARSGDGQYTGVRWLYNQVPLSASFATGKTKYANALTPEFRAILAQGVGLNDGSLAIGNVPFLGDYSAMNIGAAYDFKVVRVLFQHGTQKRAAYTNTSYSAAGTALVDTAVVAQTLKHTGIGLTAPFGATTLKSSKNGGARNSTTAGAATLKASQMPVGATTAWSNGTRSTVTYSPWTAMKVP